MLQHWDGSAWTLAVLPDPLPLSELFDVDASAPDNVLAVGTWYLVASMVLHFNDVSWIERTPPSGT